MIFMSGTTQGGRVSSSADVVTVPKATTATTIIMSIITAALVCP